MVHPSMMEPWQDAWHRIRAKLRAEFGDATFDSWLKPLAVLRAEAPRC